MIGPELQAAHRPPHTPGWSRMPGELGKSDVSCLKPGLIWYKRENSISEAKQAIPSHGRKKVAAHGTVPLPYQQFEYNRMSVKNKISFE